MWLLAAVATPGVMFSGSQMFAYAHMRAMGRARAIGPHAARQRRRSTSTSSWRGRPGHDDGVELADAGSARCAGAGPSAGHLARAGARRGCWRCSSSSACSSSPCRCRPAIAFTFVTVGAREHLLVSRHACIGTSSAPRAGRRILCSSLLVNMQLMLAALFGPRRDAVRRRCRCRSRRLLGMIVALGVDRRLRAARCCRRIATAARGVMWNPAAWFVGVYRWIAGDSREVFAVLAARGALAGVAHHRG